MPGYPPAKNSALSLTTAKVEAARVVNSPEVHVPPPALSVSDVRFRFKPTFSSEISWQVYALHAFKDILGTGYNEKIVIKIREWA